jgi:lipopolysaccharide transport system ATP-binding protein
MSDSIIKVQNLSKSFMISHETKERYQSLRDVIAGNVRKVFKPARDQQKSSEEFWALRELNFEIKQGDRLGIMGRNGAGKSTLLKILSRITEPTSGRAEINGRVASLLEVGTGFHPELTGRENIFLNGAILGMSRAEIRSKFDEIVAFAEVEKFLDTPVKRYSSGMYVRLAFAVAAHLEPEILIVDEVLAVGDAEFQKKCIGKMQDVSRTDGKTIIFVSHNASALGSLCKRGLVLSQGSKTFEGDIQGSLNYYAQTVLPHGDFQKKRLSKNLSIELIQVDPLPPIAFDDLSIKIVLKSHGDHEVLRSLVLIIESAGKRLGILDMRNVLQRSGIMPSGQLVLQSTIHQLPLVEGDYSISLYIESTSTTVDEPNLTTFSVLPRVIDGLEFPPYEAAVRGNVEFFYTNKLIN